MYIADENYEECLFARDKAIFRKWNVSVIHK